MYNDLDRGYRPYPPTSCSYLGRGQHSLSPQIGCYTYTPLIFAFGLLCYPLFVISFALESDSSFILTYCNHIFLHRNKGVRQGLNAFGGKNIRTQLTMDGKAISVVHTPKEVYQALGMIRSAQANVRRHWNSQFKEPIHKMSPRNRRRAVSMTTSILQTVLRAFGGKNWKSSYSRYE